MKKGLFLGYGLMVAVSFMMQSCQDDPIFPVGSGVDPIDTTWVGDSTNNDPNGGGGTPIDSTNTGGGGTSSDSLNIVFDGGVFTGNATPFDSAGGNWNPNDSLGGN